MHSAHTPKSEGSRRKSLTNENQEFENISSVDLRSLHLLQQLPDIVFTALVPHLHLEARDTGDVIARQGDELTHWIIVLDGHVSLHEAERHKLNLGIKARPVGPQEDKEKNVARESPTPAPDRTTAERRRGSRGPAYLEQLEPPPSLGKENRQLSPARPCSTWPKPSTPKPQYNLFHTETGRERLQILEEDMHEAVTEEHEMSISMTDFSAAHPKHPPVLKGVGVLPGGAKRHASGNAAANGHGNRAAHHHAMHAGGAHSQRPAHIGTEERNHHSKIVCSLAAELVGQQVDQLGPDNSMCGDELFEVNHTTKYTAIATEPTRLVVCTKAHFRDVMMQVRADICFIPGRLHEIFSKDAESRTEAEIDTLCHLMTQRQLLANLPSSSQRRLARVLTLQRHPKHRVVWRQGDCATDVYLILQGYLSMFSTQGVPSALLEREDRGAPSVKTASSADGSQAQAEPDISKECTPASAQQSGKSKMPKKMGLAQWRGAGRRNSLLKLAAEGSTDAAKGPGDKLAGLAALVAGPDPAPEVELPRDICDVSHLGMLERRERFGRLRGYLGTGDCHNERTSSNTEESSACHSRT
ncbi:hypothetical protein CYMTET_3138, partial [Cymbomonas tetramitiformis]